MPRESDTIVRVTNQRCFAENDKAIMVAPARLNVGDPRIETLKSWIPKSLIDRKSQIKGVGDKGNLLIPVWVAEQNDLEYVTI